MRSSRGETPASSLPQKLLLNESGTVGPSDAAGILRDAAVLIKIVAVCPLRMLRSKNASDDSNIQLQISSEDCTEKQGSRRGTALGEP